MRGAVTVHAAFDDAARVWFVQESDLRGLNVEAPTLEALVAKLPAAIVDLIEDEDEQRDIPIEVIAYRRSSVRIGRSA
jgi:hypothetical protein